MRAVIQRCSSAAVYAQGEISGRIQNGLLVLLGVGKDDRKESAELLAKKVAALRIFCDENDKINLSVKDCRGAVLVVSNFTLFADTKKGNRPSFTDAMDPISAKNMYDYFCECLRACGVAVETGVFKADMQIDLKADGPVTILLDTDILLKNKA